jgi:hypothetical protein
MTLFRERIKICRNQHTGFYGIILTRQPFVCYFCIPCESSSVVELHLAKVAVAGSSPVSRSSFLRAFYPEKPFLFFGRHSQVVRQRSAKPSSPVQIWMPPQSLYSYIIRSVRSRLSGGRASSGLSNSRANGFSPFNHYPPAPLTRKSTADRSVLTCFDFALVRTEGDC